MKQSSKSISSPSRGSAADLFPPPLVSFLRADAGNRSKTARSRSSPIFIVRKKNVVSIETQEPSSPKVTCMGQVRSSNKTPVARCRWVRSVLSFSRRHCRTFWNRSAMLFRRTLQIRRKSVISESRAGNETEDDESENENENDGVFAISSPPKNALILTRCRSTPHRQSYYGNRNRSSPMRSDGIGEIGQKTERRLLEKLESCIGEGDSNSVNGKESKSEEKSMILTRCKSEPGRIAEKLFGELNLGEEERSVMA